MEEREVADHDADGERGRNAVNKAAFGAPRLLGAYVLRHERGHGLAERGGHKHDEAAELFRNAHTCGDDHAEGVHDGRDGEEGDAHEHILQRDGETEPEHGSHAGRICLNVALFECEGQLLPADDEEGKKDAERLGRNGRDRRACRCHFEYAHEQIIAQDVEHARKRHGHERDAGIADAAEHAAEHVIGHDEERPCGADAHVIHRCIHGFGRGLHDRHKRHGKELHHDGEQSAEERKQRDARADDLPGFLRVAFAELLPEQHRRADCDADDERRHKVHQPACGGNGGNVRGGGKLADDHHVHRAVHRLQKQREQNRQREAHEGPEDRPF